MSGPATARELRLAALRVAVATSYVTEREAKILTLYAQGFSAVEIAARLKLSHKTVESHVRYAKERLNARNIHHLIAMFVTAKNEQGAPVDPVSG